MLGAIIGDVIGSVYEWHRTKEIDFLLFSEKSDFTDDTILTVATAECLLEGKGDYEWRYKKYALDHIDRGFGGMFLKWAQAKDIKPAYGSYGNGSAMRVSPIGYAFDGIEETINEARRSASVTHNHEEGMKGAEAVASAIFLARKGDSKEQIRHYIRDRFGYNMGRTIEEIRPTYQFDTTCQGSVPEAVIAFLDSTDFESAIRLAVSLGGDSDTLACIAGGIAEAFYKKVPIMMIEKTWELLPIKFQYIVTEFYKMIDDK